MNETLQSSPAIHARPLACITGASSGIGAEFARRLARDGYDLLLVARRRERLESLSAELCAAHGIDARPFVADLSNGEDVSRLETALAGEDRLELLVNNAGFGTVGYFASVEAGSQARMVQVHLLATVRLTRAALPGMVARRKGAIVNVSSLASFFPLPGNATYSSTKVFLNNFSEALALELRGSGVKVQALCPGFTRTELHKAMKVSPTSIGKYAWMDAQAVVETSLRALKGRRVIVIPGLLNGFLAFWGHYLPHWLLNIFVMLVANGWRRKK